MLTEHEARKNIIVKNENSEAMKESQGLVEGLKEFKSCSGILAADSLISLNNSSSQFRAFNLSDIEMKFF